VPPGETEATSVPGLLIIGIGTRPVEDGVGSTVKTLEVGTSDGELVASDRSTPGLVEDGVGGGVGLGVGLGLGLGVGLRVGAGVSSRPSGRSDGHMVGSKRD
jgi:hypothetical protein